MQITALPPFWRLNVNTMYEGVRKQVFDGDVIIMRDGTSWLNKATHFILSTPYDHLGLAIWLEGYLWMAELRGSGVVMLPLRQHIDRDWDVFDCPVEDRPRVRREILKHEFEGGEYDYGDLARIAWARLVGSRRMINTDDEKKECATWGVHVLMEASWVPIDLPVLAAPSDVAWALGEPKAIYRGAPNF